MMSFYQNSNVLGFGMFSNAFQEFSNLGAVMHFKLN